MVLPLAWVSPAFADVLSGVRVQRPLPLSIDWSELFEKIYPWVAAFFFFTPDDLPGLIARVFDYGLKLAVVWAVIKTLRNLPLIKDTMREFNEGRGRI